MKKTFVLLALCLFAAPFAFADVGPGPDPPQITVNLVANHQPYTGSATATFLCSDVNSSDNAITSPVAPHNVELSCANGKCVNDGWYYKFNPCFYSKGKISVQAEGKTTVSPEYSFESPGSYILYADVAGGEWEFPPDAPIPDIGLCGSLGLILLPLAAFAFIRN